MYLAPTRSARPPDTPVVVYDGGCPFCTVLSRWLQHHARQRVRLLTFDDVESTGLLTRLSRDEVVATAHFVTLDGIEYHGGEAVTRALRLVRFGSLAAVLDLPGSRLLRDAGYALVSRSRPLLSRWVHPSE